MTQGFFIRATKKLPDREEEGEERVLAGDKAALSLGLSEAMQRWGQGKVLAAGLGCACWLTGGES